MLFEIKNASIRTQSYCLVKHWSVVDFSNDINYYSNAVLYYTVPSVKYQSNEYSNVYFLLNLFSFLQCDDDDDDDNDDDDDDDDYNDLLEK